MTDREIETLSRLREALGVGHKIMLTDLPVLALEIKRGHDRYEKLRKLSAQQAAALYRRSLNGKDSFDSLVDALP